MPTESSRKTTLKKGVRHAASAMGAAPRKVGIKLTDSTKLPAAAIPPAPHHKRTSRTQAAKVKAKQVKKAEARLSYRALTQSDALKDLVGTSSALKLTTTVRLEPRMSRGLKILQVLTNRPANKILNEALEQYIDRSTASTEARLDAVLALLKEYRRSDPGFRKAIGAFVDAEVTLGKSDPAEGAVIAEEAGPAVTMVRNLLRG